MTEEVENTEVVVENQPELTEIEQEASKEGWRPKDQWTGNEVEWIPADEFMRRKPLFGKISELKSENYHTRKELQEVKQTLRALSEHHKKVRETEYERALTTLQLQRRDAMDERDHDTVIRIEEQIDTLKDEKKEFEQQLKQESQQQAQPTPEYLTWVKENDWYLQDQEMHADADAIAVAYLQRNKAAAPETLYKHVSEKIRRMYPEKFEAHRGRPDPVESGNSGVRPSKTERFKLTDEQEQAARNFEKQGIMTRAEYIAELKKLEEK